jgi:hypothetical protein
VASGVLNIASTETDTPLVGETEMLAGHVIDGGALSTMVNGNEQVLALPALSIAVHDTLVVVWIINLLPELGHTRL